jgi:hypothetical protein
MPPDRELHVLDKLSQAVYAVVKVLENWEASQIAA